MACELKPETLTTVVAKEIPLDVLPTQLTEILAGRVRGRLVVRL
jgi:NADPH:quinone reductase-like Zn-dependent oxidoreductase